MNTLSTIGLQITHLLLALFATILLARALLHHMGALTHHPLLRVIEAVTRPVLSLPHKLLPPTRQIDFACWITVFLISVLELHLRVWFSGSGIALFPVLFVPALLNVIKLVLYLYIAAILIYAISGWFMQPQQQINHPLISLFMALIAPLLTPLRRVLPSFAPIDISPMVLLLIVYIALIIISSLY